jgi:hypothetical protein
MLINHTFLNILIFHPKHATHCTILWTIFDIFEHTLKYSNQAKQIYSTYSWFIFIKHTYFCNYIIYKNNSFSVSKISPDCIGLLTWTSPQILVTRTQHWRTNWSLQAWHEPANTYNVRLCYGTHFMKLRLPAYSYVALPVSKSC